MGRWSLPRTRRSDLSSRTTGLGHMISRRTRYKRMVDEIQRKKNRTKARMRAKVEHPFHALKRMFGLVKVRFRGLKKNHDHLCAAFALVDVYMHRKRLAPNGTWCVWKAAKSRLPDENNNYRPIAKRQTSLNRPSSLCRLGNLRGCGEAP
jgi:Transposase DDE domain